MQSISFRDHTLSHVFERRSSRASIFLVFLRLHPRFTIGTPGTRPVPQLFHSPPDGLADANAHANALTRPDTVPTRSDNVLVTGTEFDDAGREIYPDSDDLLDASEILQNGSDNVYDRVEFQYNRQSERNWKKDQNGTIHTCELDNLGRILHDRVTTLGSGVDNSVLRLSTDYTADGNVATLTSYDKDAVHTGVECHLMQQVIYGVLHKNALQSDGKDAFGYPKQLGLFLPWD
jgi:hypothetical protein